MFSKIHSAALNGLKAIPVDVEVNAVMMASAEMREPLFVMVGLPDSAVRESRQRVQSAFANSQLMLPRLNVTANFAPADIRKEGSGFDLPLAVAILRCAKLVHDFEADDYLFVGELGLDGSVRPVRGVLPIAIEARARGFKRLIVPKDNEREAGVVNRIEVYGIETLSQLVGFLNGQLRLSPVVCNTREEFGRAQAGCDLDFADVKGQERAKRAFEVAAAGGHNILLIGSPGCGKSMMAKRVPGILPSFTLAESLETTQIFSIAGLMGRDSALLTRRPFRAPHHTISDVALIGGGSQLKPGEISLAHNGVLFLDEFPEYSRNALETLRQPLEDRCITISRAKYSATLPCSFMLVAAMNPCPCGYYNDPDHACTCSPGQIRKYMGRISGPLLDRIDLHLELTPVPLEELQSAPRGESSADIRRRVEAARAIQTARFADCPGTHCNAQMTARQIERFAIPDADGREALNLAMKRLHLSARSYERILKMARTIADLAAHDRITFDDVSEAVGYRTLDREDWGE